MLLLFIFYILATMGAMREEASIQTVKKQSVTSQSVIFLWTSQFVRDSMVAKVKDTTVTLV
jgi:hypothetical protein